MAPRDADRFAGRRSTSPRSGATRCSAIACAGAHHAARADSPLMLRQGRSLRKPLAHTGSRDPGRRRLGRDGHHADRARLRGQPARLHPVRPIRTKPRVDRAPPRRGGGTARQSRHHRRLARRLRAGAPRAGGALRTIKRGHELVPGRRRRRHPAGDRARLAVRLRPGARAGGLRGNQSAQASGARAHRRAGRLYPRAQAPSLWCSAPAPPAPARPGSRSRKPCRCSSARKSTASSCRGRRWKPASGSASCPATCARRSIPICARSTTRCTI